MAKSNRLLLVEGVNDKSFFEQFCKAHGMDSCVKVAPPREFGGIKNSKQGAIRYLATLLQQVIDTEVECLGLVLDADQIAHGGGFANTVAPDFRTFHPKKMSKFLKNNELTQFWHYIISCAE